MLDSSRKISAMVLSLDLNVLGQFMQRLGCCINWVQLPLLLPAGAQAVFNELKYEFKVGKESEWVLIDQCSVAHLLTNMCNGHP
jgi:hypothetical protein